MVSQVFVIENCFSERRRVTKLIILLQRLYLEVFTNYKYYEICQSDLVFLTKSQIILYI